MRWRAVVAYDGTGFVGWQTQSGNGRTVQEELEGCLSTVLREEIHVEAAGRTDTGVHARGQVIAFDLAESIEDVPRALHSINSILSSEVRVYELRQADPDFDPRRHAVRRTYRYRIWNAPFSSPFEVRTSWHVRELLEIDSMREAARALPGRHDFFSFQTADNIVRPSVRELMVAEVHRELSLVEVEITANAFCRGMVRNLVGQLVEIGRGRAPVSSMAGLLAEQDRSHAAPAAPPRGLFLERVDYS
jgi:tRNA pseudouridine38-40 synthase